MKRLFLGLALAAALAGCGGDDENDPEPSPAQTQPGEPGGTGPAETPPHTETSEPTGSTETEGTSPEDQPGGAGDEEPIRSEAVFACRGSGVAPRSVSVPPYIAIKVRLSGRGCTLRVEGETLSPGDSADLDGLRPQERYTATAGDGSRVRVVANAEPGP